MVTGETTGGPTGAIRHFAGELYGATLRKHVGGRRHRVVRGYLTGDILDLGCGTGLILPFVADRSRYVGVDMQESALRLLRARFPDCRAHRTDLTDAASLSDVVRSRFDTITLLAVIEHLEEPLTLLRGLDAFLKPRGRLLITCPSPFGDRVLRLANAVTDIAEGAPDPHIHVYSKRSLMALVLEAGLVPVEYRRFLFGLNQLLVASARD